MIIKISHIGDKRKGRQWSKQVSSIDASKNNGYAFGGRFLQEGENDLNEFDIVLQVGFTGSWKNGESIAIVLEVQNGELVEVEKFCYRSEFLSLRNRISSLLNKEVNPLMNFSDNFLLAEVKRRGLF